MTKTFCDKCGVELDADSRDPHLVFKDRKVNIDLSKPGFMRVAQIAITKETLADLCNNCVFDAIAALDDRPKAVPTPAEPHECKPSSALWDDPKGLPPFFCTICGKHESHDIHMLRNRPHAWVIPRGGTHLSPCFICDKSPDDIIHQPHPPHDVQNIPALFGGSVKE